MHAAEAIGWASSALLVLTLAHQVHKQWKSGHSEGVSRWLFIGQIISSIGFTAYSLLVRNWVFVVTNALILIDALVGFAIVRKFRAQKARQGAATDRPPTPSATPQLPART